MNGKQNILEFQLWQRIRNFFDRNSESINGKKQDTEIQNRNRKKIRRVGDSGEIRLVPPPKGKSVRGNANVGVIYTKLKTAAQAARANRLNNSLYGNK